ncbi:MAG: hypothetical protein BWK78_04960 [Thiotrichaceae bacterium IS1]|nr:MAG: hypothetical protein BWK78_04960 [Thiotrichaceae bacterium IS1]
MKAWSFSREKRLLSTLNVSMMALSVMAWTIPTHAQEKVAEAGKAIDWTPNVGQCFKVTRNGNPLKWSRLNNQFLVGDEVAYVGDTAGKVDCKPESLTIKVGTTEVIVNRESPKQTLKAVPNSLPKSSGPLAFLEALGSLFFEEAKASEVPAGSTRGVQKCELDSLQYLVKHQKGHVYIPFGGVNCLNSTSTEAKVFPCGNKSPKDFLPLKPAKDGWRVLDLGPTIKGQECYQLDISGWKGTIKFKVVDSLESDAIDSDSSSENFKLEAYYRRNNFVNNK